MDKRVSKINHRKQKQISVKLTNADTSLQCFSVLDVYSSLFYPLSPHFPSFPPNQPFPSQFSHQHQMKNYPHQWNQSRKNHQMRPNPVYIDDQFQNYPQNQHLMHQGPQPMGQFEQQHQIKAKQQQKEVEKRNKEKE